MKLMFDFFFFNIIIKMFNKRGKILRICMQFLATSFSKDLHSTTRWLFRDQLCFWVKPYEAPTLRYQVINDSVISQEGSRVLLLAGAERKEEK